MKISVSYREDEVQKAETITEISRHLLGKVKITRSAKHKPFRHIYIATRELPAADSEKMKLDK